MSAANFRTRIVPLVAVAMVWPAVSTAQNLGFLKDAAVSYFNEKDVAMMMQTVDDALNQEDARAISEWKNPESGNSGKAEVLRAFKNAASTPCKRVRVTNVAHNGVDSSAAYTLCKDADKWMVVSSKTK